MLTEDIKTGPLEQGNDSTMLNSTLVSDKAYYVYPRFKSFLIKTTTKKVHEFAAVAGVVANTISNINSGKNHIAERTIESCQDAVKKVKTERSGDFIFVKERMPAETFFEKEAIKAFIGNKSKDVVAKIFEIEEYFVDWIVLEKPISIELAKHIEQKAREYLSK